MSEGAPKTPDASTPDDLAAELTSERISRRARAAAAVSKCVATKTYGDTVTRTELLGWFSLTVPAVGTKREFDRVELLFASLKADFDEAMLTDHKMAVESKRGGNWRIVLPEEQATFATRTARDGIVRALAKGRAIVDNVKIDALSDAERARRDFESSRLAGLADLAAKSLRGRGLPTGGGK